MRKLNPARLALPLVMLFALGSVAAAQSPADARGALSKFPDSQAVLYVNAHKLVNEVLPRLVPAADYRKMVADAQKVGFDVRGLQFAAAGVRFNPEAPADAPPDFVLVVRGDFNADSLLALGKIALGAQNMQSRSETYGSKSIEIINTDEIMKKVEGGDASKAKPNPYPEVAVAALDSKTFVAGVPSYVRAAIDSANGRGALKPSMLGLASQDSNAIWSLTADIPPNLAEMAHKYGAPANPQFDDMVGWVKQVNVSQGMTALDFTLSLGVTTDLPEHASAFSGLVRMGQAFLENALREAAGRTGKDAARAREGLAVLTKVVNRADGNTLTLSVSVPQKTVINFINEQRAKPGAKTGAKPTRKAVRRRAPRR